MELNEAEKLKLKTKYKTAVKQLFTKPTAFLLYFLIGFAFLPAKYLNFLPSRKRNILNDRSSDLSETIADFIGVQNFVVIFSIISIIILIVALREYKLLELRKDLKHLTKSEFSGLVERVINKDRRVILQGDAKYLSFENTKMPKFNIGQKVKFIAYTNSKELIEVTSVSDHLYCLECSKENSFNSKRCSYCNVIF